MESNQATQPGGFFPARGGLPSPAPSSTASASASALPHPRGKALQPGSNKEDTVRRYVEERLMNVSRRYVKKFGNPNPGDKVTGYRNFSEVCRDLGTVVNVLWLSGTPSLQIPFLLRLASDFTQYVRSFPPSPRPTFELLGKLDHCFSSLLAGQDVDSRESLPGFENGLRAGMTVTDMVRCRSLVEQTRVLMVEILTNHDGEIDDEDDGPQDDEDNDTTTQSEAEGSTAHWKRAAWEMDDDRLHLDAARIYENTIVQLGERLGDSLGNGQGSSTATTGAG